MSDLLPNDRPYEELKLRGDFGLEEGKGFEMLTHELGGGFYRSILTGARAGLRSWVLVYKTLRDTLDAPVQFESGHQVAQATYLWEFFERHKTGYVEIDRPFIVTDISTSKRFLVRFADHSISRTMFMTKLFTSQLKLVYARVPGYQTLPDGSTGNSDNPAQI